VFGRRRAGDVAWAEFRRKPISRADRHGRTYEVEAAPPSPVSRRIVVVDAGAVNDDRPDDTAESTARPQATGRSRSKAALASADSAEAKRRTEILQIANAVIASSGLRTTLRQIGDAAGILAGSLYHHFESKDALLTELLRRYHADLDRVGAIALGKLDEREPRPVAEQIVDLGRAVARTAVEHRAALQMSFYERHGSAPELIELTQRRPTAVQNAMESILRAGRWSGYLIADIDVPIVADRLCQSMLHVGLEVIRHNADSDQVAAVLSRIMLHGLATSQPRDAALDRSSAFAVADSVVGTWADEDGSDAGDKVAHIRAVARAEFGRRGYELTSVRDIASAAGVGASTVYRLLGSKEELLMSIMSSFGKKVGDGWTGVLTSDSTAAEKLDAMSWLNINAVQQFPDEFRIQLAWMRHSPPDTANPGWSFTTRLQEMQRLLSEGIRSGEMTIESPTSEMLARCVIEAHWMPENILREVGAREALLLARDTVLRGIVDRDAGSN
jgi:AcrR family transcriptional regulator